jgi:hypothetical protein
MLRSSKTPMAPVLEKLLFEGTPQMDYDYGFTWKEVNIG